MTTEKMFDDDTGNSQGQGEGNDKAFNDMSHQEQVDYLAQLVGEGKKFKTPNDLAKGKIESDTYIERLQNEMAELRQELNSRVTLEEVLEKIESRNQSGERAVDTTQSQGTSDKSKTEYDPEAIKKMVKEEYNRTQEEQRIRRNQETVIETLKKSFGDDYKKVVKDKSQELGLELTYLEELASKSPKAFFTTIGVNQQMRQQTGAPATSTQSFSSFNQSKPKMSEYSKLRREDPVKYFSPEVQRQIFQYTKELGEEFLNN